MIKKIIQFVMCFLLIFSLLILTSCNNTDDTGVNSSNSNITILVSKGSIYPLNVINKKFQDETGISIVIEEIEANSFSDYINKRNIKLYDKNGPTLLFIDYYDEYDSLINSGVALNIENIIPNMNNVYRVLKNNYMVPIGINLPAITIDRKVFDELEIDKPSNNWHKTELDDMYDKWLRKYPCVLTSDEYNRILNKKEVLDFDIQDKSVKMDIDEVKEYIVFIKDEINSGKYIINKAYNYDDYYNVIYNVHSDELINTLEQSYENEKAIVITGEYSDRSNNCFNSFYIDEILNRYKLYLPSHGSYKKWGYIVNSNGVNINEGLEYLNYLLSDDIQYEMYNLVTNIEQGNNIFNYMGPPITTISKRIEQLEINNNVPEEAINLRKYAENKMIEGTIKPLKRLGEKEKKLFDVFYKEIHKIVFSDKQLTDEEVYSILVKLKSTLEIMVSE